MRWNVDLVLDTVSQLVPLVAALVAEELPVDCHATEVTVIFITPVLTVVSAVAPVVAGDALLVLFVKVVYGEDLVLVLIPTLELVSPAVLGPAEQTPKF